MSALVSFFADTYGVFVGFVLAAGIALVMTPVAGELARRVGAIDQPHERKIHSVPTPRMGGVAIFFGVIIPSLLLLSGEGPVRGILVGASLITLVGVLDDVRGTRPVVKLALQVGVAVILVLYGIRVDTLSIPGVGILVLGWAGYPFTVLWVVALMNIVNFIDGMDGLAAGVCAISSVTFAIIAVSLGRLDMGILAAVVAGSTLGFLWYNFHPASIFMGDSGSLLLGFLLAAITLQGFLKGVATVALVIPLMVLGIPIFDTGFAILRRMKNRRPIHIADRGHIHHRFSNLGYTQRQTVMIIYAWSALMSLVALAMRFAPFWMVASLGVVAGMVSLVIAYELEIVGWKKSKLTADGSLLVPDGNPMAPEGSLLPQEGLPIGPAPPEAGVVTRAGRDPEGLERSEDGGERPASSDRT
ncbi:MAG: undecaprenyl/decaprenyl-phosphate alpha-N-acetylglucosaminyl 1-phosphate transferase [Actinobacteria bacterium]|nr:undecaprenyl/decaprenyl-phosphate alpha-N-acetylglucosaminyl 1-phosphate transferase [Actinomycetota bacterium]